MSREYGISATQAARWYDLFSRGARDWLRHNEKVRESVRSALPELVSGSDVLSKPDNRVIRVPVRLLEHYRFRLREADSETGAGQGQGVKPGDVLRPAGTGNRASGGAGSGEGGLEFVVELKVDDILDWMWEELRLPHLEPKAANTLEDSDFVREGWDKRGVRARLDRRRTLREAVKRRAVQGDAVPFSDEDLRFRQITRRPRPSTVAVVIYVLDVSSSMDEESRKLAKTFFFWSLQGLRRQHTRIESVFVGHTVNAWEFSEEEFFQIRAAGGTEASSGLELAQRILQERYDPAQYNAYLFYASDGDNFAADHDAAWSALRALVARLNFIGYLEVGHRGPDRLHTEMGRLFGDLMQTEARAGAYAVSGYDDVWKAIREFFVHQAEAKEE
ncbi:MAG: DUF444 family protein [Gammaproteobacteria bacterium]